MSEGTRIPQTLSLGQTRYHRKRSRSVIPKHILIYKTNEVISVEKPQLEKLGVGVSFLKSQIEQLNIGIM